MRTLKLRPHHFLCALNFRGKGYSKEFIDNFKSIIDALENDNSELIIEVVWGNDDVCSCCPHGADLAVCAIKAIDKRHMEVLNLPESLTWKGAKEIIKREVNVEAFRRMCAGCPWRDIGICEASLIDFLQN